MYDLQTLGIDLRDVFRGEPQVSPRYVLWLVGQLPDTSAFAASVRGGSEFRAWGTQTYLLAASANMLYAANQQRAGKKSIKPLVKPPTAVKPKRVVRVAELAAMSRARKQQTEG